MHLHAHRQVSVAVAMSALLLAISAVTAVGATTAKTIVGDNIKHPDYTGAFASENGHGQGELQIKITDRDKQGRPLQGLFQPKRVAVFCVLDDESYEGEYRLSPYVVYFRKQGRIFEGFDVSGQAGHQSVLIFTGKLTNGGAKASGDIVILDNPGRTSGEPYCSTGGKLPWSAKAAG